MVVVSSMYYLTSQSGWQIKEKSVNLQFLYDSDTENMFCLKLIFRYLLEFRFT